jgi:protein phosphatase
MTTDHTMVNELLKSEGITQEQAEDHPYKHVLSRALGVEKNIIIEEKTYKPELGDRVL